MRWLGAAMLAALAIVGVTLLPGPAGPVSVRAPASVAVPVVARGTETGELQAVGNQRLSIRTTGGSQTFRTTGRTEWRDGARVVTPDEVLTYRGNAVKVHFSVEDGQRVAEHVVISPERATPGRLVAYNAPGRVLWLATPSGPRRFTLDGQTWCRVGSHLVRPESLPVGQPITVTTSARTGQVISIRTTSSDQ